MKLVSRSFVLRLLTGVAMGLALLGGGAYYRRAAAPSSAAVALPSLQGTAAVNHLKEQGLYAGLGEAMAATRYQVQTVGARVAASNPAQSLSVEFTGETVRMVERVRPPEQATATPSPWEIGVKLRGIGYGDELSEVSEGTLTSAGNRVEIGKTVRDTPSVAIREWYVNRAEGLEQGFTLTAAPGANQRGERLHLALAVTGDLHPQATADGSAVALLRADGELALRYEHLVVNDATGQPIPAQMRVVAGEIWLAVDDRQAVYPLTIDPTFVQQGKLAANDGAAQDYFGSSVAISGNRVAIGAPGDDTGVLANQGSVYVFARTGNGWTQESKLVANDAAANDYYGSAVALTTNATGTTLVVGAPQDDIGTKADQGSVYVYTRSSAATSWLFQAKLTASDGAANDQFGKTVTSEGDTVAVGAPLDDILTSATTFALDSGSAYVFTRAGSVWSQQQKLTASDKATGDQFGTAVAISGNYVVAGAPQDDISGNTDQGSAYVFLRAGTTWSQTIKLAANAGAFQDRFGSSVAINNGTIVVGAPHDTNQSPFPHAGSAYVFIGTVGLWIQQAKLTPGNGEGGDGFGYAVAVNGNTAIIGAWLANGDKGAAYVFNRCGLAWYEDEILTADDGAVLDNFGKAVALSGETVVLGASLDDIGSSAARGSAYVHFRGEREWVEQTNLTASNGADGDQLGYSVAISGDTVVAGAPRADILGTSNAGAVYVFVRTQTLLSTVWVQQAQLTSVNPQAGAYFGNSVAINGNTLVARQGNDAAKVYVRSGSNWSEQATLDFAALGLNCNYSLAIRGNTILAGVYGYTGGLNGTASSGPAVTAFVRSGTTWSLQQVLTVTQDNLGNNFGGAIALSEDGNKAVIGASWDGSTNNGAPSYTGAAYVFVRSGSTWTQQQKLTASDGAINDTFGNSVAINGSTIAIGAASSSVQPFQYNPGKVYVFQQSGSTWTQQQKLLPLNSASDDEFGNSVALSDDALIVSKKNEVYFYERSCGVWSPKQMLPISTQLSRADLSISGDKVAIGALYPDSTSNKGSVRVLTRQLVTPLGNAPLVSDEPVPLLTTVSAASYAGEAMASEMIAAAFGAHLSNETSVAGALPLPTELAGTRVLVKDSLGVERAAPLFFVSPAQINYQVPAGTALGTATVTVKRGDQIQAEGTANITAIAPGLFTANASGAGVPAAQLLRVRADGTQVYEPLADFNDKQQQFVALPIDLTPPGEQVYLSLYGTGLKYRPNLASVTATLAGRDVVVTYAGAQGGLAGLDQINLRLPRDLAGRGSLDLMLYVNGQPANVVTLQFK